MKKGFTLAELLGVIVILGLIALITIPAVTNSLENYKSKLCKTQVDYMIAAAKNWGADHILQLPDEGETVTIAVSELIKQGYLEADKEATGDDRYKLVNPKTSSPFPADPVITITKTGKKIQYTIDSTTEDSCY